MIGWPVRSRRATRRRAAPPRSGHAVRRRGQARRRQTIEMHHRAEEASSHGDLQSSSVRHRVLPEHHQRTGRPFPPAHLRRPPLPSGTGRGVAQDSALLLCNAAVRRAAWHTQVPARAFRCGTRRPDGSYWLAPARVRLPGVVPPRSPRDRAGPVRLAVSTVPDGGLLALRTGYRSSQCRVQIPIHPVVLLRVAARRRDDPSAREVQIVRCLFGAQPAGAHSRRWLPDGPGAPAQGALAPGIRPRRQIANPVLSTGRPQYRG